MVHSLIGKPAPTFSAMDTNGETYNFTTGGGVPTVLFFYPKAGSMGCIREVSQLQTLTKKDSFKQAGVRMVGVSADSVEKQKEFAKKQKLTYPILSDKGGKARRAYSIARFLFWPSTRTTFIIDKAGKIRAVLDATVNNGAHAKFVDRELDKLAAEEDDAPSALQPVFSADVNASTYAIPAL